MNGKLALIEGLLCWGSVVALIVWLARRRGGGDQ